MIMESLGEYLETVAGYIFDDDKLVTYKWLSKELEIHVNIAKQTLWEYWQRYKEEKDFECTFLLMGVLQDNGMRVEVVREKDLSTAKEKYSKVLSEHIYSLQKVLPELQLLGLAEKGDIRYAAIKCLENNERSDEEINALRWGAMSNKIKSVPREETVQPIPESNKAKKISSPEEKHIDGKKNNADRKGFNNLFGKATGKQTNLAMSSSTEKKETDSSNKAKQTFNDTPASSKKPGQKDGLNSFFHLGRNQSADKKTEEKNSVDKTSEDKMSADKESADSPERKKNTSLVEKSKIEKKVIAKNISKQKNARGKKRNRSKESNDTAKRRKRITIHSDSSGTGSSDEEEEIPPSPEKVSPVRLPRSPSPPRVQLQNGKRKVLKKVDKTFEEDGFLVTKKVHVYESCSEEEPEVAEVKKPVAPEPQPEAKGKKSTKQTTLMNFFKRS